MPNINAFWPVVQEKIFEDYQNFPYSAPLFEHMNPHPPGMFPVNFGWNWPSGSWKENF